MACFVRYLEPAFTHFSVPRDACGMDELLGYLLGTARLRKTKCVSKDNKVILIISRSMDSDYINAVATVLAGEKIFGSAAILTPEESEVLL